MTEPTLERITLGALALARQTGAYHARFVRAGSPKRADGSPADWTIPPDVIQSAVEKGLFNDKPVFLNHASFFDAPSLGNLVGRTGPKAAYNPADHAAEGEIRLLSTPAGELARTIIGDILASPGLDIGLSMVFYPVWEVDPSAGTRKLTSIKHIESVDLVFQPAADGRILAALSSAALSSFTLGDLNPMPENTNTPVEAPNPGTLSAVEGSHAAEWTAALAQSAASVILANSGLPETARARLAAQQYSTPADLQTAIEAEREYLASLAENQVIQIGNTPPRGASITNMRTSLDRIALAFESLIAGTPAPAGVEPLTGIRELYHRLSGDFEMSGMFHADRIQLSNVNSSTMANMVANVLNKRVAAEFQNYNLWWQPIVLEEDFQSLQAIKWTILGGVGELPTVAEGAAYTELTWDDSAESGTFIKKGGYLGLTLEAIDKDETGRLRGAPRALAQAAWLTLSKAISNIFTQSSGVGPTMSDSKALFHTDHGNLGTTALSLTTWNAARLAMRKQTELNSGERLGALTTPKFLLVPPDLENTALQVLASPDEYTYALSNGNSSPVNPNAQGNTFDERLNSARRRVIVVDLWTDTNDWAAACDPRMYPTIGIGYRYGRSPEIFSVASPTAGLMFTNDTMPVKVRFFFAVAPVDYRGLYKANVA